MKKLVFAALAIVAMAACTKSNVQYEQLGEIAFQPVAQKATKSAITSTTYPTSAQFNVWAWWDEASAGTNDVAGFDTKYIEQGTFGHRDGNSWGGVTPYYWPTTGSLFFAGYSPAVAQAQATSFEYDIDNGILTIEDYAQSSITSETLDLLWFDVTDKSYDQNGTDGNGVPVVFKHALSWLTFKFNLNNEDTEHNWKIKNVVLESIETHASATIVKGENPVWITPTISEEMTIYSNTSGEEISYVAGQTWTNGNSSVTDFGGTVLENTSNGVIVIPQSCASGDAKLVVTYDLKNPAGEPAYLENQTVDLGLTVGTNNKWEPGKHYIYTIVFGANEILIVPEVAEWIEEVVEIK